jgi:hypothetical protein
VCPVLAIFLNGLLDVDFIFFPDRIVDVLENFLPLSLTSSFDNSYELIFLGDFFDLLSSFSSLKFRLNTSSYFPRS